MKTASITVLLIILILAALPAIASDQKSNPNSYTISLGEGMSLRMTVVPFEPKKHKITECQIIDWSGIALLMENLSLGLTGDYLGINSFKPNSELALKQSTSMSRACTMLIRPRRTLNSKKSRVAFSYGGISPMVPVAMKLNGLSLRIVQYGHD